MNKSELRKKLVRYSEMLVELKSIQTRTIRQKENKTREILALKRIIKEMKEELYGQRMDKR
jgi:hypothetical protein